MEERFLLLPSMADLLRNVLGLNAFTPRYMMKTAFELMLQSVDALKRITPETCGGLAWQEFQNKLQAFYLFEHVDSVLGISPDAPLNLAEMVSKATTLGPFFSAWATEGLGHYYTLLRPASVFLNNSVGNGDLDRLPPESMVPLHTGMGLALAEAVLTRREDSANTAETFVQLCRDRARPEFLGATIEALGLVARNLYPESVKPLSDYFWQWNKELFEYFWHGVGRGIYFAPINFLPYWSAPWQGYEMSLQEPPNDAGRRNAVAGFAWALTLVNVRQPAIVAAFLERHGEMLAREDAFVNGVFSALVIWLGCAPKDTSIDNLLGYQPDLSPAWLGPFWEAQVRRTAEAALHFRPTNVGALFRYHPFHVLSESR